jgi:cytochrome bd-type quinol oxidase subunit 1
MIAILVCVGLIVVLLTATVVFLVRKRRAKNSTKSLEVIPMQYPSDKMMAFGNGNLAEN